MCFFFQDNTSLTLYINTFHTAVFIPNSRGRSGTAGGLTVPNINDIMPHQALKSNFRMVELKKVLHPYHVIATRTIKLKNGDV